VRARIVRAVRSPLASLQVIESHPEHPFPDIRVLYPPAALRQLVDAQYADLGALSNNAFAHTPWALLLIKAVDQWKAANNGALPTAYKQKKEIRSIVEGYRRPGVQADQNVDEALSAINTALNTPKPSSSVAALLAEARAKLSALVAEGQQMAAEGDAGARDGAAAAARKGQLAFWLMAAATERFVANEGGGLLPLVGTIPDMTADTTTYVALQQLYAQQARRRLTARGRTPAPTALAVPAAPLPRPLRRRGSR
jgi:amyloid beta precursor protein binding protein 1